MLSASSEFWIFKLLFSAHFPPNIVRPCHTRHTARNLNTADIYIMILPSLSCLSYRFMSVHHDKKYSEHTYSIKNMSPRGQTITFTLHHSNCHSNDPSSQYGKQQAKTKPKTKKKRKGKEKKQKQNKVYHNAPCAYVRVPPTNRLNALPNAAPKLKNLLERPLEDLHVVIDQALPLNAFLAHQAYQSEEPIPPPPALVSVDRLTRRNTLLIDLPQIQNHSVLQSNYTADLGRLLGCLRCCLRCCCRRLCCLCCWVARRRSRQRRRRYGQRLGFGAVLTFLLAVVPGPNNQHNPYNSIAPPQFTRKSRKCRQ